MDVRVVGEDGDRIWLYKPAGVPCFPPHGNPDGDSVLAQLLALGLDRGGAWPDGFAGGIAHRLDTATDGLLLVARHPAALHRLREEWGQLRKFYRFRSDGVVTDGSAAVTPITVELAHHPNRKDRMVARRGPRTTHRGRWYPAWTAISDLGNGWWEAEIRTGVMHQVRVHAAFVGLPLVGDAIYGGAAGEFRLTHVRVVGPGWLSPAL